MQSPDASATRDSPHKCLGGDGQHGLALLGEESGSLQLGGLLRTSFWEEPGAIVRLRGRGAEHAGDRTPCSTRPSGSPSGESWALESSVAATQASLSSASVAPGHAARGALPAAPSALRELRELRELRGAPRGQGRGATPGALQEAPALGRGGGTGGAAGARRAGGFDSAEEEEAIEEFLSGGSPAARGEEEEPGGALARGAGGGVGPARRLAGHGGVGWAELAEQAEAAVPAGRAVCSEAACIVQDQVAASACRPASQAAAGGGAVPGAAAPGLLPPPAGAGGAAKGKGRPPGKAPPCKAPSKAAPPQPGGAAAAGGAGPGSSLPSWRGPRPPDGWRAACVVNWQPIRDAERWEGSVWEQVFRSMQSGFEPLPDDLLTQAFGRKADTTPRGRERQRSVVSRHLSSQLALTADLRHAQLLRCGIDDPEKVWWVVGPARQSASEAGDLEGGAEEEAIEAGGQLATGGGEARSCSSVCSEAEDEASQEGLSEGVLEALLGLLSAADRNFEQALAEAPGEAEAQGPDATPPAEAFLRRLLQIAGPLEVLRPRIELALRLARFRGEAMAAERELRGGLVAVRAVVASQALPALLEGVLLLGNYVNASSRSLGGVVGVTLDSLCKLAHTRCHQEGARRPSQQPRAGQQHQQVQQAQVQPPHPQPQHQQQHLQSHPLQAQPQQQPQCDNALHFLARHLQQRRPLLVDQLCSDLGSCVQVRDLDMKTISKAVQSLASVVEVAEERCRATSSGTSGLGDAKAVPEALQPRRLRAFLREAAPSVARLRKLLEELRIAAEELRCHLAEPRGTSLQETMRRLAELREALPRLPPPQPLPPCPQPRRLRQQGHAAPARPDAAPPAVPAAQVQAGRPRAPAMRGHSWPARRPRAGDGLGTHMQNSRAASWGPAAARQAHLRSGAASASAARWQAEGVGRGVAAGGLGDASQAESVAAFALAAAPSTASPPRRAEPEAAKPEAAAVAAAPEPPALPAKGPHHVTPAHPAGTGLGAAAPEPSEANLRQALPFPDIAPIQALVVQPEEPDDEATTAPTSSPQSPRPPSRPSTPPQAPKVQDSPQLLTWAVDWGCSEHPSPPPQPPLIPDLLRSPLGQPAKAVGEYTAPSPLLPCPILAVPTALVEPGTDAQALGPGGQAHTVSTPWLAPPPPLPPPPVKQPADEADAAAALSAEVLPQAPLPCERTAPPWLAHALAASVEPEEGAGNGAASALPASVSAPPVPRLPPAPLQAASLQALQLGAAAARPASAPLAPPWPPSAGAVPVPAPPTPAPAAPAPPGPPAPGAVPVPAPATPARGAAPGPGPEAQTEGAAQLPRPTVVPRAPPPAAALAQPKAMARLPPPPMATLASTWTSQPPPPRAGGDDPVPMQGAALQAAPEVSGADTASLQTPPAKERYLAQRLLELSSGQDRQDLGGKDGAQAASKAVPTCEEAAHKPLAVQSLEAPSRPQKVNPKLASLSDMNGGRLPVPSHGKSTLQGLPAVPVVRQTSNTPRPRSSGIVVTQPQPPKAAHKRPIAATPGTPSVCCALTPGPSSVCSTQTPGPSSLSSSQQIQSTAGITTSSHRKGPDLSEPAGERPMPLSLLFAWPDCISPREGSSKLDAAVGRSGHTTSVEERREQGQSMFTGPPPDLRSPNTETPPSCSEQRGRGNLSREQLELTWSGEETLRENHMDVHSFAQPHSAPTAKSAKQPCPCGSACNPQSPSAAANPQSPGAALERAASGRCCCHAAECQCLDVTFNPRMHDHAGSTTGRCCCSRYDTRACVH